jgi:hypothetical protein
MECGVKGKDAEEGEGARTGGKERKAVIEGVMPRM